MNQIKESVDLINQVNKIIPDLITYDSKELELNGNFYVKIDEECEIKIDAKNKINAVLLVLEGCLENYMKKIEENYKNTKDVIEQYKEKFKK